MNPSTPTHEISLDARAALSAEQRQRCEVWTRVMGYHRPVASFNVGKQGEHRERRFFVEPLVEPSAESGAAAARVDG